MPYDIPLHLYNLKLMSNQQVKILINIHMLRQMEFV